MLLALKVPGALVFIKTPHQMCSISNKGLLLARTALKMYQGFSPIPGYSAFTAACNTAHHSSVQREDWGEANSDQGTIPICKDIGHHPASHSSPSKGISLLNVLAELSMGSHLLSPRKMSPHENAQQQVSLNYLSPMIMDISTSRAERLKSS